MKVPDVGKNEPMDWTEVQRRMSELGDRNCTQYPRHTWDRHRCEIRRHTKESDGTNLLKWSTLAETMFVGDVDYVHNEFAYITSGPNGHIWLKAILEPGVGDPARVEGHSYTSGNLIHQAYHLRVWQDITRRNIKDLDTIIEFGGGYGSMALIAHRLGFEGKYIIYDVPEVSLLQEWYLSQVEHQTGLPLNVVYRPFVGSFREPEPADLLVGCWSLSEAPIQLRWVFLDSVRAQSYLLAYQHNWQGENVAGWFDNWTDSKKSFRWWHVPTIRESCYALGVRRV